MLLNINNEGNDINEYEYSKFNATSSTYAE